MLEVLNSSDPTDMGHFGNIEKILLHLRTQIAFVSKHPAVVVFPMHVFEIIKVMNIGSGHVIRGDDTAYPQAV